MLFRKNLINALTLFVNDKCNLECIYCFEDEKTEKPLLTLQEYKKVIIEAKRYGAKSVIIVGKEPMLYKDILRLIDYAFRLNLKVILYTNGTMLTKNKARFLCNRDVNIHFKLDTLDEKVYKRIVRRKTGIKWSKFCSRTNGKPKSIPVTLKYVIEAASAGRGRDSALPVTIELCATRLNYKSILELAEFCRDNIISLRVERLIKKGGGEENYESLKLSEKNYQSLFSRLTNILGENFVGYNQAKICMARDSLVIHENGDVGLCAVQRTKTIGNIKETPMRELIRRRKALAIEDEAITFDNNFKICAGRRYMEGLQER